uniref:A disintegrin and metalloproteinase with thrombospondin motifs 7-like n=1 Tax=Phallusia mammillata TaxID=59560 RepID=A0A6F9D622_9ASCI|nr:A disintegrin and metalloproteinase with thrombospondin motifs 7-like [Phallusia mammillata]
MRHCLSANPIRTMRFHVANFKRALVVQTIVVLYLVANVKSTTREKIQFQPLKFDSLRPTQAAEDALASIFGGEVKKSPHKDANSDYDVTHPVRVNSLGEFLSHKVDFAETRQNSRRRRDINDPNPAEDGDEHVYFKLRVNAREVTLNVSENKKFLHSNFVVERLRNFDDASPDDSVPPQHRSSLRRGTTWPCHFRGHVADHDQSAVAISTCNGLTGFIRLDDGDYFIEPMTRSRDDVTIPHPHKVYRRDVTKQAAKRKTATTSSQQNHGTATVENEENVTNRVPTTSPSNASSTSGPEFCGVIDTRTRYKSALRSRARWEADRRDAVAVIGAKRRRRRSLSLEQWIEMMVVVDKKMVEYYEAFHEGEVEKYALTVVNMVSELFHDASIGNSLHVTLIRLIILEGEEKALKVSQHAEKTLDSFCRWAKRMNPRSDHHANHHDVAVLLTRRNICSKSNTSCETLGLAHVAGMCQPHRSCNVNQDTGLSVAFTVAHELGHNFAMHHDGQLNKCTPNEQYPRVMAPHLTSNNLPMRWSSCSRRYATRFLDRNWGFCLMDTPSPDHDTFDIPVDLPGTVYNANHQCRLMFGPTSRHCRGIDNICNRLWCLHQGTCRSRLHAAAPGTKCGKGRWCFGGACVPVGKRPSAVNGSWSGWTSWSRCSRTCGIGVSFSARYCDRPPPSNGGSYCLGERRRYRTCNIWDCPKKNDSYSFREEQCTEFNHVPYRNKTYTWFPVDSAIYPCELHCYTRTGKRPFADRLKDKVVDGTPCYSSGKDICVDGVCKRLGCDLKIDSVSREDKCGVCHGDGTSCSDVKKTFNLTRGEEYVSVGILPLGARDIRVHEAKSTGNFLALKNPNSDEYYLNGRYRIQWDTKFKLAGTYFTYERVNMTLDNITATGPITMDIEIMVLFVEENPGIEITYVMPHNVSTVFDVDEPVFEWMSQKWSSCSRSCGKGVQMSVAICVEKKAGIVEEDFCNPTKRPDDRRRTCHHQPCPAEWQKGPWQPCSVTCGKGIGRQRRSINCIRSLDATEQVFLRSRSCSKLPKPDHVRPCPAPTSTPCPTWRAEQWSNCSTECGEGTRNRTVNCVTYYYNDVIVMKGGDVAILEDEVLDELESEVGPGSRDVLLAGDIARLTMNTITVTRRRRRRKNKDRKQFFDSLSFEIVNDDQCEPEEKPITVKDCEKRICTTSSPTVSPDPLLDVPSVQDPLLHIRSNIIPHHDEIDRSDLQGSGAQPQSKNLFLISNLSRSNTSNELLDINTNSNSEEDSENRIRMIGNETVDIHQAPKNLSSGLKTTSSVVVTATTTTTTEYIPVTPKPIWLTGYWGHCSTSCGMGARIRNVECSSEVGGCDNSTKPPPVQRCILKPCAVWMHGEWTKCSKLCGRGIKYKKVQCRNARTKQIIRPYHCKTVPRPRQVNATCNMKRCLPWKTSRWSRCNVTCGSGTQRRRIACSKEGMCNPMHRPPIMKPCMPKKCVEWRTSNWERCSVNCGSGLQHRTVQCVERDTGKASHQCSVNVKPNTSKKCNQGICRVTEFDFSSCQGDRLKTGFCRVLKSWGKCVQPSLAIQCCTTCKTFTSVRRKNKIA